MNFWTKVRLVLVLIGNHNRLQRPLDAEFGVVVPDAAFAIGRVKFGDEIKGLGVRFQSDETMGETLRHIKHGAVFRSKLDAKMLQEGGRILAQINDGVEKGAAQAADDFVFSFWRELIVHSAQRTFVFAGGIICLDDFVIQSVLLVFAFAKNGQTNRDRRRAFPIR